MEEGHPWQGLDEEVGSRGAGFAMGRHGQGSELFPSSGSTGVTSRAFFSPEGDP